MYTVVYKLEFCTATKYPVMINTNHLITELEGSKLCDFKTTNTRVTLRTACVLFYHIVIGYTDYDRMFPITFIVHNRSIRSLQLFLTNVFRFP